MLPLPILFEDDLDETIILDSDDNENMFQFRDAAAVTTNWPMNSDCDGDGVSDGVDWNGDGAMNQFCMPATLGDRGLSIDINEDGEIDIAALEGCDVDPSSNEATRQRPSIGHQSRSRTGPTSKSAREPSPMSSWTFPHPLIPTAIPSFSIGRQTARAVSSTTLRARHPS